MGPGPAPFDFVRFTLKPGPQSPSIARRRLRRVLAARGLDDDTTADLVLAVSEIVTNAVEATGTCSSPVTVEIGVGRSSVRIVVENRGSAFRPQAEYPIPPAGHTGGRGLAIASRLCSELSVTHDAGRTRVSLTRLLPDG